MAAVVEGDPPYRFVNHELVALTGSSDAFLAREEDRQIAEIVRRRALYRGHIGRVPVAGRTAIVVDDGIATGATMRAALHAVMAAGASSVVVAVPVAPADLLRTLEAEADDVVCLESRVWFRSIGEHYRDFHQLTDEDVIALLDETRERERRNGTVTNH